ncbi:AGAP013034-PA [Anopheles gambiae str. PEST]|uniref:AGAP013034-PA n=2 Tax=gambiae species complex TaxID=44542 RepID=F5HJS0_ANOGA|nr:AGAP013034-PA [Anopheles gambiae str. PEST]
MPPHRRNRRATRQDRRVVYLLGSARVRSFRNWPYSGIIHPLRLAYAGFCWRGVDDKVHCFDCGLTLGGWLRTDDPWEKHARSSPNCPFIENEPILATEPSPSQPEPSGAGAPQPAGNRSEQTSAMLCKICMDREANALLIPCRHLLCCKECGLRLASCPVCRQSAVILVLVNVC